MEEFRKEKYRADFAENILTRCSSAYLLQRVLKPHKYLGAESLYKKQKNKKKVMYANCGLIHKPQPLPYYWQTTHTHARAIYYSGFKCLSEVYQGLLRVVLSENDTSSD